MKRNEILAGVIILLLMICSLLLNMINIPAKANIIYSITALIIIILLFIMLTKNNKRG